VAVSIQAHGFCQPIAVYEQDIIIVVGHTRYKAAHRLNLELVPVHGAVGLTPA
jgi:ParB-like chromosome segregation protein Spo0J